MNRIKYIFMLVGLLVAFKVSAWPGMEMPKLHIEGRYLLDENGNEVLLHGFGQTYSPWFNEQGSKWSNYDVNACLKYNKGIIDGVVNAGWKVNYVRMHMDPYWSNTPGVSTTGENDISAFDFNRFRTYLTQVFIPMAEYAISKGLYVVMRPPGVCPEHIAVNDAYHKYLLRVWGYISTQRRLTNNPHIMFELANEPVNIMDTDGQYRSNTDGCNKNLTQFFQQIVDLMRDNGCNNILWVPGTGYQSQYAGFAKYPVKGDNIGYAVHVYPGWYGSDAIEPSHELGGSYGGGYESFAAGWKAQIEPCAAFAPILVTEMDWLPSVYEASWGKSITGKMLGAGFGANFKLLADRTGNVSWMLFTGPELMKNFDGKASTNGKYTMYNDPDGCIWSGYHWYKEYAGDQLPDVRNVDLYLSPRGDASVGEKTILTGSNVAAAIIADRGLGIDFNVTGDIDVTVDNSDIIEWDDAKFKALRPGKTTVHMSYTIDGKTGTRDITFNSTPFPFKSGIFNPSIYSSGTFNESTGIITTGQWGFAGWQYANGLDLSDYRYIVCELDAPDNCGISFRLYDENSYWTSPAMTNFNGGKRVVMDLTTAKKDNGNALNRSHIYIAGFWTTGGQQFKVKSIYPTNNPDQSGIDEVVVDNEADTLVDVVNMQGIVVRHAVEAATAADGLPAGMYIIGGKKIIVRN